MPSNPGKKRRVPGGGTGSSREAKRSALDHTDESERSKRWNRDPPGPVGEGAREAHKAAKNGDLKVGK
jgi:hypothetical protein